MNRRALIAILILIVSLALSVLLMNRRGSFVKRNTTFSVGPETEVSLITLSSNDRVITLRKTRDGWLVNAAGEASGTAISTLLKTLTGLSIKSPVTDEQFETLVLRENISPVSVRVWSGRRRVISFLVYKTDCNPYGNIMKRTPRSRPFIVSVPGSGDDIGSVFSMYEQFWLPYVIFNIYPSEIESVDVHYTDNDTDSFTLCNPFFSRSEPVGRSCMSGYDTLKVRRYLSYFTGVPLETWAFELEPEKADSIKSSPPLATVTVHLADGTRSLRIWERKVETPEGMEVDHDRVWGMTGESELLLVARYYDVDPLLRRKSYFLR